MLTKILATQMPGSYWSIKLDELVATGQWHELGTIPGYTRVSTLWRLLRSTDELFYYKFGQLQNVSLKARHGYVFSEFNGSIYKHPTFLVPASWGLPRRKLYPALSTVPSSVTERIIAQNRLSVISSIYHKGIPINLIIDELIGLNDYEGLGHLPGIRIHDRTSSSQGCLSYLFNDSEVVESIARSTKNNFPSQWFTPVMELDPGDYVFYYKYDQFDKVDWFEHVGRYQGDDMVLSKFGKGYVYLHKIWHVPSCYGMPMYARLNSQLADIVQKDVDQPQYPLTIM